MYGMPSKRHLSSLNNFSLQDDNGCDIHASGLRGSKYRRQEDAKERSVKALSSFYYLHPRKWLSAN
jgi:hypothetical protein